MSSRYMVVFGACLTQFTVIGLLFSFGLFFKVFEAEFGWSRTLFSASSALSFFMMGTLAILGGRLSDRYGPRRVLAATGLAYGLGYALLSQISAPWQLFLIFGTLIGAGLGTHDVVTLSTVARWFQARRGMMTAVVKVGTAVGQIVVPPIVAALIAWLGWRSAVTALGVAAAVLLLIGALSMKAPPVVKVAQMGAPQPDHDGVTFAQARSGRLLWTVCAIQFLFFPTLVTVPLHLPAHAMDLGMTATGAATLLSVIGAASIFGRLALGRLIDVIGGRMAYLICLSGMIIALIGLTFVVTPGPLYAVVAIYGFSHGALFVVVSPTVAEYFGMRAHGAIFGLVLFFGTLGASVGPILAGRLFDTTGSYFYAFLTLIALICLSLLLTLTLPGRAQERTESAVIG
ncbi:MFS transporter [Arenibacterium sp. CAU 1754]